MKLKNTFYLMRHGEAESNVHGILSTSGAHFPLTARGRAAAAHAGVRLRAENLSHIYASPVRRARETAEIVGDIVGLPVAVVEGLHEIAWGQALEGRSLSSLKDYYRVATDRFTRRILGGETWIDVKKRMLATLERINHAHTGDRILLVSHSDPIWLLESGLAHWSRLTTLKHRTTFYPRFAEVHEIVPWGETFHFKSLVNGRSTSGSFVSSFDKAK